MIEITKGDLLKADVEALVNTVNCVGVMGRGIALQFKKAFPDNFKAYKKACDQGDVRIGEMFVSKTEKLYHPKYIVNFPTKNHWKGKSKKENIESGLSDLVRVAKELNIQSIAIPPLGCGLGGLQWPDIRLLIENAFQQLPNVRVLLFEPAGTPAPGQMINRTKKPRMTIGRAAVLGLMNRYLVPGYDYTLSLLEVQKLAYFLQSAGEPLRLNFEKHYYGPYAENLQHVLNRMEGHYISGFGDGNNKPDVPLSLRPHAAEEAESFLQNYPETKERFDRVTKLIECFETPYGMELLASVHWVAAHENSGARNDSSIAIRDVLAWNERKKKNMKENHIQAAWDRLKEQGWLE